MDENSKNKTILIVEDEAPLLKALSAKFKHEGYATLEARDGEEGLETALSQKPDMILLDIVMPKMDGLTMLEMLRKDAWGKDVPVMLLTNLNDPIKVADAIKEGVYDYLVKTNWKLEDVLEKVAQKFKTIPSEEEEE